MKVWQAKELVGSSDITLVSCFTTACLDIIKVEKSLFFFFQNIKCLTEVEERVFVRSVALFSALIQCRSIVMCQTETWVISLSSGPINTDLVHFLHLEKKMFQIFRKQQTLYPLTPNLFKFSFSCDYVYFRETGFIKFNIKPVPW